MGRPSQPPHVGPCVRVGQRLHALGDRRLMLAVAARSSTVDAVERMTATAAGRVAAQLYPARASAAMRLNSIPNASDQPTPMARPKTHPLADLRVVPK